MSRRNLRGFTLLELLVTVAVATILAVVAVPSYQAFIANQRAKTMAQELMLSLMHARSEAIKRNAPVHVNATGGNWSTGWVITTEAGKSYAQCEADPAGCLRMQGPTPQVQVTAAVATFTFDRTGRPSSTASMTVCDPGGSAPVLKRAVDVNLIGRASIRVDGKCGA